MKIEVLASVKRNFFLSKAIRLTVQRNTQRKLVTTDFTSGILLRKSDLSPILS